MSQARKKEWDIVVVGSANLDYWVQGPKLPTPGASEEGDIFQEGPGGKGANQAVAAARLGAQTRVALIARVGNDARGKTIIDRLKGEGVDTSQVKCDKQAYTGVALIQVDQNGQKQILAAFGANRGLSVENIRAAKTIIQAAKVLLVQLEIPLAAATEAIGLAYEAGVKVILDPAPAPAQPLSQGLLSKVEVIKPNANEARQLTGIEVKDQASARQAAKTLMRQGVKAVAVQAGDEGNLLLWNEGERWLPKLPVESVDATGAGDAFAAGLGVMLAQGHSLEEAGIFANAAAAQKTTQLGAQAGLPDRKAVIKLLEKYKQI